jgi:hypothetical protein
MTVLRGSGLWLLVGFDVWAWVSCWGVWVAGVGVWAAPRFPDS